MEMTTRVLTGAEITAEKKLIAALPTSDVKTAVREKTESEKKETMLDVLIKYIPVTVIVGYTFLDTIFRSVTPVPVVLWMGSFIVLLIGAGILTYKTSEGAEVDIAAMLKDNATVADALKDWQDIIRNQRIKQSGIAVIAFTGYVMSIGGPFTSLSALFPGLVWQAYYGSVALVFATLFIAIIAAKDLLAS
jgi:hypothetical protein